MFFVNSRSFCFIQYTENNIHAIFCFHYIFLRGKFGKVHAKCILALISDPVPPIIKNFETPAWLGQTQDYKFGIYCFSSEHDAIRSKSKGWLAVSQNNVFEWSDMATH